MRRILIVGTDRGTEEACRREFQAEGYHVDAVADPELAPGKVQDAPPDLVILDLCMPQAGISCLESLAETHRELPVVLHAGYLESWGDFRLWSADSYIEKSEDLSGLKEAVHNLLPGEEVDTH